MSVRPLNDGDEVFRFSPPRECAACGAGLDDPRECAACGARYTVDTRQQFDAETHLSVCRFEWVQYDGKGAEVARTEVGRVGIGLGFA